MPVPWCFKHFGMLFCAVLLLIAFLATGNMNETVNKLNPNVVRYQMKQFNNNTLLCYETVVPLN